jgi:hypothetical protein
MNDIELYLKELMGDFSKKISPIDNSRKFTFTYYKTLYSYPTIQMVIKSPFIYNEYVDLYVLNDENVFMFFLYDMETDMIIGKIEEIDFDENWQEELMFSVYDAENKLPKYICPICDFWLIQRTNKYGHSFLGCCGYPECTFSCESDEIID